MSRRKQQNPKPLKYGEVDEAGLSKETESSKSGVSSIVSSMPAKESSPTHLPTHQNQPEQHISIKHEPESPRQTVDPSSPPDFSVTGIALPEMISVETSLEHLLGVPDDAPLKVERSADGCYRILSAKHIAAGAGLDPLRAQKIEPPEDEAAIKENPQIVSFLQAEEKVFFLLEKSINCGWLKYLGIPSKTDQANLRIYYVGGQLWVEVIKSLMEGEQLIAEFCEPSKKELDSPAKEENGTTRTPSASPKILHKKTHSEAEAQFPCTLCGIQFRNPNTLTAHKKHYCSKLNSTSATSNADQDSRSTSSGGSECKESITENIHQTAYICLLCKFMSLTKTEMKSHIKEKHKTDNSTSSNTSGPSNINGSVDKTYCEDCEIHFKKAESYQAHKQHYCKNRTNSQSPRSEHGGNQSVSQPTSPVSPNLKEMYKKVSVFDNQTLSASLASQAAAAMAAASLPFTLSSMLSLPAAMASLPMMPPHLKMFQSPAHLAQAMQSVAKVNGVAPTPSPTTPASISQAAREETPLDLSVKQEDALASTSTSSKRRASTSELSSPLAKNSKVCSEPASPAPPVVAILPRQLNNSQVKPIKPERPIYRCESCSIPFYKKDVYEAHKLHYCSRRPNSGSDREEEAIAVGIKPTLTKPELPSPPAPPSPPTDERLVITYTCNKCSTSYRTIETFTAHQCAVPQASPPTLHCDECSFSTHSSRILAEHTETHQKINLVYKCKLCGYHGNTLRGMRQHGRQHLFEGAEFSDNDVESMELTLPTQRMSMPPLITTAPFRNDVDEELLRLKNEPYKKRRSRKHYQKSEYMTVQISPQRKENGLQLQRAGSSSPHSVSTVSCTSPLQNSTMNVPLSDRSPCNSPSSVSVKREPVDIVVDPGLPLMNSPELKTVLPDRPMNHVKAHVCSCNASFASISTFEAHKKLYCPHHKGQRSNGTIAVNN